MTLKRISKKLNRKSRNILARKLKSKKRRLPKTSRPTGGEFEDVCDYIWAECVKHRAGLVSEISGTHGNGLHAHRILKKANRLLRYHSENGVALTASEHMRYEKNMNIDDQAEMIKRFPRDLDAVRLDNAEYLRGEVKKEDWPDIYNRLTSWYKCLTDRPLYCPVYIIGATWDRVHGWMEKRSET